MWLVLLAVTLANSEVVPGEPQVDLEQSVYQFSRKSLALIEAFRSLPPFRCDKNCFLDDWRHRDAMASSDKKWNKRCSYALRFARCYCFGKPRC